METKAHHVLIGAFVLLTLIGAMFFALWVAKVSLDDEFDEYDVAFHETVTGLTKGAAVNFNGIQVGEVRRLSLDREDAARVLARVRVSADTPIKTDTSARLTYTGLTGVAIIELVAGDPDSPPLEPPPGEVGIIEAKPSAFQKFMTDGGDVLVRFNEALGRITQMLSDENAQSVTQTLAHVESIAAQVDQDKADLSSALRRADKAFADLSAASDAFQDLARQSSETLARTDLMLRQDLAPAADDLRLTLTSLRDLSARVEELLSRNSVQLDQFAQQGMPELTATLEELRQLAASMNRISTRLETAPTDYLLQRDRPREYRPQ
jgi:phospholipid/cholesterol/gamma-HCH transport system substrate-binding protein